MKELFRAVSIVALFFALSPTIAYANCTKVTIDNAACVEGSYTNGYRYDAGVSQFYGTSVSVQNSCPVGGNAQIQVSFKENKKRQFETSGSAMTNKFYKTGSEAIDMHCCSNNGVCNVRDFMSDAFCKAEWDDSEASNSCNATVTHYTAWGGENSVTCKINASCRQRNGEYRRAYNEFAEYDKVAQIVNCNGIMKFSCP